MSEENSTGHSWVAVMAFVLITHVAMFLIGHTLGRQKASEEVLDHSQMVLEYDELVLEHAKKVLDLHGKPLDEQER